MNLPLLHARLSALAAFAGLVVSWAFFSWWMSIHGVDLSTFWTIALTANEPGTGLTWDLVFSGVITTVLTAARARALGPGRVVAILLGTWILGVCVGLGLWAWWLPRAEA